MSCFTVQMEVGARRKLPGRSLRAVCPAIQLVGAILLGLGSRAALAQNLLFVTNGGNNSVTIYARTANGNAVPLRTIRGAATGLSGPAGLAVDTVNSEVAVANLSANSVTVYALTANGNAAPLRTIAGAATGLSGPKGLAMDTVNNELLVGNGNNASVTAYARTANGNVTPLRTIAGAATGLSGPVGLAVDTVNGELAVADYLGGSVRVYARTADGNVAPLRTIAGAATGLNAPYGLTVDTVNDELAAANYFGNSVTVYARTANGNIAPLRTIAGAATGLNRPEHAAADTVNNELVVGSNSGNSITVYARTASGDVAPLRTLAGAATGLNGPRFVAITIGASPSADQITPSSGPSAGGTSLGIDGTGFQGGAALTIGSVPAVGVSVAGPTHIDALSPALPAGTLNDILVTNPDSSSATLPEGFFADFLDVPQGHPFHRFVEKLVRNKVTAGCGGGNDCPADPVTRAQMAVFLLRSKDGPAYNPPVCTTPAFIDYSCSSGFAPWINELASRGVTAGCGGGAYCPNDPVTRAQMAVFLLRTLEGSAYTPPACATPTFADVPCSSPFARWIDELALRGITAGCGGGNYCPASALSRGQMAVFLVATFHLP